MGTNKVELYIYDLSRGMAEALSPIMLGKKIDGIWHTAIVVYGREYFFGSHGISSCNPAATALGQPLRILKLGETQIPYTVFIDYIKGLSESFWAGRNYDLFRHNCNNFSQEIAQFLCGASIPKYILDLPSDVLNSTLGPALPLLVSQLEKSARPIAEEASLKEGSPEFEQLNSQIEEVRYRTFLLEERRRTLKEKEAKKEKKKQKKRKKLLRKGGEIPVDLEGDSMAEAEVNGASNRAAADQVQDLEDEERREEEEKKKSRDPPIVYGDALDVKMEYNALLQLLDGKLAEDEQQFMEELELYVFGHEGSWALSDGFLTFIGRLLHDQNFPDDVRVRTMNVLAMAALKDDIILVLHQDRKDHLLMNYAFEIDRHTPDEQQAIALFFANMFENLSSSEWLTYISEWTYNNQQTSNLRVTTKVAVHCLLSGHSFPTEAGTAIIHNLACKEVKTVVFDDVAVELTMAVLEYLKGNVDEERLYRSLKALSKFVLVSAQEVPQLIQMIGPDPRKYKGISDRIDQLVEQISIKLR